MKTESIQPEFIPFTITIQTPEECHFLLTALVIASDVTSNMDNANTYDKMRMQIAEAAGL